MVNARVDPNKVDELRRLVHHNIPNIEAIDGKILQVCGRAVRDAFFGPDWLLAFQIFMDYEFDLHADYDVVEDFFRCTYDP